MEVWKEIDGYNQRYEVSNYGRVGLIIRNCICWIA